MTSGDVHERTTKIHARSTDRLWDHDLDGALLLPLPTIPSPWLGITQRHRIHGHREFARRPRLLRHGLDASPGEPMKGVTSCDKPRGAAGRRRCGDPRMGLPDAFGRRSHLGTGTPGTEASYYRQEKKANAIPLVTASERGIGQTESVLGRTCGVWLASLPRPAGSRTRLERRAVEGDSPVGVTAGGRGLSRVARPGYAV